MLIYNVTQLKNASPYLGVSAKLGAIQNTPKIPPLSLGCMRKQADAYGCEMRLKYSDFRRLRPVSRTHADPCRCLWTRDLVAEEEHLENN